MMYTQVCSDDIVRLAFDATSAGALRQEILRRLVAATGSMAGLMANPEHVTSPCDVVGFHVDSVERGRILLWKRQDFHPAQSVLYKSLAERRAISDATIMAGTLRNGIGVRAIRSVLGSGFLAGPGGFTCLVLAHEKPDGFGPEIDAYISSLLPALAVASAAVPCVADSAPVISLPRELTERQREICLFVVHGYTNVEIARACSISLHTVRNHLVKLFRDFAVSTRTELASRLLFMSEKRAV